MNGLDDLTAVLERTTSQYDVRVPFYGIATGKIPVWHCEVAAYVGKRTYVRTANEWRLDALCQAHDLVAALREIGWVLNDAPRIQFSGTLLSPARFTLGNDLFMEPQEGLLSCEVTLSLDRFVKDVNA